MKLATQTRNVEQGGVKATRNFTVKVGAHIMQVLSGLYTNPIDAMVREYMTNMIDAYTALRKVNPNAEIRTPEIHAPGPLTPTLEFRDYGIGMDNETVWEVYSQYGASTKTDSNDETGGFGLGSKTAFCYNSGQPWTIVATKDNVRNSYMAFVGEDGVPQLSHVSRETGDFPSGVSIKIPILRNDIAAVTQALNKYVPFFPMPVELVNWPRPVPTYVPEYTMQFSVEDVGDITFQHANVVNHHDRTVTFVMGGVPYIYDIHHYRNNSIALNLPDYFNKFSGSIYITVPVGTFNPVPSRDALKFDPHTIANMKKIATVIKNNYRSEVDRIVRGECDTAYDRWIATQRFAQPFFSPDRTFAVDITGYTARVVRSAPGGAKKDLSGRVGHIMYSYTRNGNTWPEINPANNEHAVVDNTFHFLYDSVPTEYVKKNRIVIAPTLDIATRGAGALFYNELCRRSHKTNRPIKYGHGSYNFLALVTDKTTDEIANALHIPVTLVTAAKDIDTRLMAKGPQRTGRELKVRGYKITDGNIAPRKVFPKGGGLYLPFPKKDSARDMLRKYHHFLSMLDRYHGDHDITPKPVFAFADDALPKSGTWTNVIDYLEEVILGMVTRKSGGLQSAFAFGKGRFGTTTSYTVYRNMVSIVPEIIKINSCPVARDFHALFNGGASSIFSMQVFDHHENTAWSDTFRKRLAEFNAEVETTVKKFNAKYPAAYKYIIGGGIAAFAPLLAGLDNAATID